jgi:hypothetical protein
MWVGHSCPTLYSLMADGCELSALSAHGNPRLSTLVAVTKAVGLKLTVEAAK